jgi:flagellar basal-body rod protein FlgB
MPIDLTQVFAPHEKALRLSEYRAQVIATNLANADTPRYKARDIDFKSVLAAATFPGAGSALRRTHTRHIAPAAHAPFEAELLYRYPHQPAVDGNTVSTEEEQAAFLSNAVRYQASLTFINRRISGLLRVIRDE